MRRIAPVTGGKVEGPNIKGEVLPFGADWAVLRPDGAWELDVRITIRTQDGELVYAYYRGIIDTTQEVWGRILSGEEVDPSEYYFRTSPVFETASEKYKWLNKKLCVGVGKLLPGKVEYKVYQIL
jgi:hypothetical protein